jgi:ABC-type uncharacterized transport system involved in gliding motility auxiliary subunit
MSDAPNPNTPEGEIRQAADIADGLLVPGGRRRLRRLSAMLAYVLVPFLILVVVLIIWH